MPLCSVKLTLYALLFPLRKGNISAQRGLWQPWAQARRLMPPAVMCAAVKGEFPEGVSVASISACASCALAWPEQKLRQRARDLGLGAIATSSSAAGGMCQDRVGLRVAQHHRGICFAHSLSMLCSVSV